jgi:hypothetical protein
VYNYIVHIFKNVCNRWVCVSAIFFSLKAPAICVGFSEVQKYRVEFKVLRAVTKKSKSTVFYYVTPRNLVEPCRRFGLKYCCQSRRYGKQASCFFGIFLTLTNNSVRSFEMSRTNTESSVYCFINAVFLLGMFLTLKIEAESSFETFMDITGVHTPQDYCS